MDVGFVDFGSMSGELKIVGLIVPQKYTTHQIVHPDVEKQIEATVPHRLLSTIWDVVKCIPQNEQVVVMPIPAKLCRHT